MLDVVQDSWNNLKYIKEPTEKVIIEAVKEKGWAIQYVTNPSEKLQLEAVKVDYDSIKYIKNPSEKVQIEAIKVKYDALRYIENPSLKAEIEAIKINEAAINFIEDLDKKRINIFLRENILIVKYIFNKISENEIKERLKDVIQDENVSEKYIRDFLNCEAISFDKLRFIYEYGSKKAKRITVDEKLKIN